MVSVIVVSADAVRLTRLEMAKTSLVANTVDKLTGQVNKVLQTQNALNSHIKSGLLNLNQQTTLLQKLVYSLWIIQQMSYSHFYHAAYVTPSVVTNASEIV